MNRMVVFLAVALSMPVTSTAVKAQSKSLPSINQSDSHAELLKDSVKGKESELSKFVQVLMASGRDMTYVNGWAQAVGLDQARPAKAALEPDGSETRKCHIVYEQSKQNGSRPICVHFIRTKKTAQDAEERYFRVGLDGQLEKVITLRNKVDKNGKLLGEGRSRVEEDINSPTIKKIFHAEMDFWLKDWLKRQQKVDAKKATASAAKPADPTAKAAETTSP